MTAIATQSSTFHPFAFAKCAKKEDRRKHDEYPTPFVITDLFLRTGFLDPNASILEPSCGNDEAIVQMLDCFGFDDLEAYDIQTGTDFFDERRRFDQVIMNPPFNDHINHIEKAKTVARHRIAALLPHNYLTSTSRHDRLWTDAKFPLAKVFVLTRGIDFKKPLRMDGLFNDGGLTFAWFCWDRHHQGPPQLHWIDNSPFVARGADRHPAND